jgi:hypothetical protein
MTTQTDQFAANFLIRDFRDDDTPASPGQVGQPFPASRDMWRIPRVTKDPQRRGIQDNGVAHDGAPPSGISGRSPDQIRFSFNALTMS